MANSPSIENIQRGLRVQRELDAKVIKGFRLDSKMSIKDSYILALQFATRNIVLDAEDNEKIAADKRKAASKKGQNK